MNDILWAMVSIAIILFIGGFAVGIAVAILLFMGK